jgi:hypothetical protein
MLLNFFDELFLTTRKHMSEHDKQTTEAGIQRPYAYHKPGDEGLATITKLRKLFSDADKLIKELTPPSREQSIAITNLEQTAMWAIKAVVINDPKSTPETK